MDISYDLACFSQFDEWHIRYHEIQQICIWQVGRQKSEVRTRSVPKLSCHNRLGSECQYISISMYDHNWAFDRYPRWQRTPLWWIHRCQISMVHPASVPNVQQCVSQMSEIDVTHSENGLDKLDDDYWWLFSWILNPCDFFEPEIEAEFLNQN